MKKKIISIFFAIALIFTLKNYSNAANAGIQCNNTATVNKPISITVTGSAVQWNLTLKVNGIKIASSSEFENVQGNKNISFSGSYTPTSTGNLTVSLEGSVTEAGDGSTIRKFGTKTITVSENTSNNNKNNNGSSSNPSAGNNGGKTDTNTGSTTKSNVATLSNLGIRPNDFSGFSANKTSYSTEVPNNVESIEIYAEKAKDNNRKTITGQKISGTGKKTLKEGTNSFSVVVISEDGTANKTYTINVTRKTKDDNSTENETTEETTNETTSEDEVEDPTAQAFGLTKLSIAGVELQPQFQTDVYEYRIELKENLDKLDIEAIATEENANVEITGNENLQDGENVITILVKGDTEDKNVAYQIIVNKSVENQEETNTNANKIKNIIIVSTVAVLVLIVIIIIVVSKVKSKKNEAFIPYGGVFEDNDVNENDSFNNYDNNNDSNIEENNDFEEYEEEKPKKKRSKGKRFK